MFACHFEHRVTRMYSKILVTCYFGNKIPKKAKENILGDSHFSSTHIRDDHGLYIVRLPIKSAKPQLRHSQTAAERHRISMERKFTTDSRFSQLYHDFMEEYSSLGHMSQCTNINLL